MALSSELLSAISEKKYEFKCVFVMYPNVHRSTVYNSQDMEAT